jgi:hypothetical protein
VQTITTDEQGITPSHDEFFSSYHAFRSPRRDRRELWSAGPSFVRKQISHADVILVSRDHSSGDVVYGVCGAASVNSAAQIAVNLKKIGLPGHAAAVAAARPSYAARQDRSRVRPTPEPKLQMAFAPFLVTRKEIARRELSGTAPRLRRLFLGSTTGGKHEPEQSRPAEPR